MMSMPRLPGLAALLLLFGSLPLSAQQAPQDKPPRVISFQGHLADAGSGAIDGLRTLVFRLYNDPVDGDLLWTETHPGVTLTGGDFQAALGSIEPLALRFNRALWLSVEVQGDAQGELAPRQRLFSQPYAIVAEQLDTSLDVEVEVNCPPYGSDSLAQKLTLPRPHGPVTYNISGACNENILIRARGAVLNGVTEDAAIVAASADSPALEHRGGHIVVVNNLAVDGNGLARYALWNRDGGVLWMNDARVTGAIEAGLFLFRNASASLTRVTIEDNGTHGIEATLNSSVDVHASTVQNNGASGILVSRGSSLRLDDDDAAVDPQPSVVQGNVANGILATRQGYAEVEDSVVTGNGETAVLAADGSTVVVTDSSLAGPAGCDGARLNGGDCTALYAVRGSNVRVTTGTTLSAPTPTFYAMEAWYNSQARIDDDDANTVNGHLRAGFTSHVEVLGATVNGDLNVQRNSSARLRNGATLNGNARVTEMSLLRGAGAGTLTITGFLECDTGTSYAYGISGTDVAGSYSLACNPPAGP